MLTTAHGVVRDGKIQLLDHEDLREGTRVLVTILSPDEESRFWLGASETTFGKIWDNPQDDVYAELLKE